MKYVLLALLAYVAWRWYAVKKAADAPPTRAAQSVPPEPPQPPQSPDAERMVGCAYCGIHLPQSEAIREAETLHFCCDEHRRQYTRPTRS